MTSEQRPISAIVAGHLCLDIVPSFAADGGHQIKDILVPGKLINMGDAAISTGGAVSNTGISLKLLGLETRLMGKIGSDYFGSGVQRVLQQYGIGEGLIVDPAAATSYSVVIAPPGIDRIFLHNPGANDTFCAADLNQELIAQTRLFHFGYPPLMRLMYVNDGAELVRIFKLVKSLGATSSLDLALPDPASAAGQANWLRILERVLPLTDICLPSLEELLYMLDRPVFERAKAAAGDRDILKYLDLSILPRLANRMLSLGVKIVVIKLGKFGYYVRTADAASLAGIGPAQPSDPANWGRREIWAEAYDVRNIASTSGAGDASIAGFLAGLLTGQAIETTTQLACATAGLKIQVKTSVGGIPPLPVILGKLAGWAKEPVDIDKQYWNYRPTEKLWFGRRDNLFGG
ncbi:MAG TPA: carbohydrate kinase family protein [Clostridiales bacterium]|nr:carbohydrate kinase family protein [Clostridiales bacterium]